MNSREQYPHEAELFDKYPRIYDKVNKTLDLLYWVLLITIWSWITGLVALVVLYLV